MNIHADYIDTSEKEVLHNESIISIEDEPLEEEGPSFEEEDSDS